MSLDVWAERVREYLAHVAAIFSPSLIVFGGEISKRFDRFSGSFDLDVPIGPAELRNNAGIVGAALAAHEALGSRP
jgi:polyphosphate glucokinase